MEFFINPHSRITVDLSVRDIKVQVLFIMRTAYSTSRQVYPSTLLSKIAEKRQTYHARFMESAFKDLSTVYRMELSRKPMAYYI